MKIAIFSDIHANLHALEAALDDAANVMGAEEFWSLGDVVGYGPHPVNAVLFLKRYVKSDAWVMGNHDAMLADLILPEDLPALPKSAKPIRVRIDMGKGREIIGRNVFMKEEDWFKTNSMPVEVIILNRAALRQNTEADAHWRKAFKPNRAVPRKVERDGLKFILVHGSQADPLSRYLYAWEKEVLIPRELQELKKMRGRSKKPIVQFYGHTHVPTFIYAKETKGGFDIHAEKIFPGQTFSLEGSDYYLINPGSVGQPRDRDQRASYIVLDTKGRVVTFRRVKYDDAETARDFEAGGYPDGPRIRLKTAAAAERETPDEWLEHYNEASKR